MASRSQPEAKPGDLPDLPLEKIFSYLNLGDRLNARVISRNWRKKIDSYPVKSLCYSEKPRGRILEKRRLVGGAFASNFYHSTTPRGFRPLFEGYDGPNLQYLKVLRLCELHPNPDDVKEIAHTIESHLEYLEDLSIIRVHLPSYADVQFELNLPKLRSLHLEELSGTWELNLVAPILHNVQLLRSDSLRLHLAHSDPVERLDIDHPTSVEVWRLKSLKFLYTEIAPDLRNLSYLPELKEIHLYCPGEGLMAPEYGPIDRNDVRQIFEHKRRYYLRDLKIYLYGCRLEGPDDQAIELSDSSVPITFLADIPERAAEEIPLCKSVRYSAFEPVASESAIDILSRFVHLSRIHVDELVEDLQSFVEVLESLQQVSELEFDMGAQPQELFDHLPEYCSGVQKLTIYGPVADCTFVQRMRNLVHLYLDQCSVNAESVRRILKELPFLKTFEFFHSNKFVRIEIPREGPGAAVYVTVAGGRVHAADVDVAIDLITEYFQSGRWPAEPRAAVRRQTAARFELQ